ncbi:MAG: SLC13 family permease [Planctomycetota bacterium]
MTIAIAFVLAVLLAALVLLAVTRLAPDAIFMAALVALLAVPLPAAGAEGGVQIGVLTVQQAVQGFANPGMLTIAALFLVVVGLRDTGAIDWVASGLLGRPRGERGALLRVMLPVGGLSAFLNNTPVVAMMIPAVQDWAKRLQIAPSRLLLPLSYAAILGGTCSLIGTSTNLVVAGLVASHPTLEPLSMFDITWVGLPAALLCGLALWLFGPWLLPNRLAQGQSLQDTREYTLELLLPEGSALAGKTIDEAGLRNLPGGFLIQVERGEDLFSPVGPDHVLRTGDRLLFAGIVDSIRELVQTRGLVVATNQVFKLDSPRHRRRLFEAVVSPTSVLSGATVRSAGFRNRYQGAVIAVARNGARVRAKIGDILLQPGDLLLVEADPGFDARAGRSNDFLLARSLEDSNPRSHERAPLALAILLLMVAASASGLYPMLVAALLAAGAMLMTRCCTLTDARRGIDWSLLTVIGASLGLGAAMEQSGAANLLAEHVMGLFGESPRALLAAVFCTTALLTSAISNTAAVALMFSVALASADAAGVSVRPFVIAVMMGGSACFATPIGYQTNLMVYGPGGYRFGDFVRAGVPLTVLLGCATVWLTPWVFPFVSD